LKILKLLKTLKVSHFKIREIINGKSNFLKNKTYLSYKLSFLTGNNIILV